MCAVPGSGEVAACKQPAERLRHNKEGEEAEQEEGEVGHQLEHSPVPHKPGLQPERGLPQGEGNIDSYPGHPGLPRTDALHQQHKTIPGSPLIFPSTLLRQT